MQSAHTLQGTTYGNVCILNVTVVVANKNWCEISLRKENTTAA